MNIPDEILTTVKGFMYQFGQFEPMVFVFGTQGKWYMPLPFGQTSDDRAEIMTRAGVQVAKSGEIGDMEQVIYVSEAWVSPSRTPYIPPSQDLNRQEVLMFNSLDAKTNAQGLELYVCVRNRQQKITDLKVMEIPEKGSFESRLLPAFMAGFRLFKR